MPEGPFGFYRPFGIAPLSRDVEERNRRIKRILSKYAKRGKVNVEDSLRGTQMNFRLDIPHRSNEIPRGQNIPSNLSIIGRKIDGTLRPPIIHTRAVQGGEEEVREKLRNIIGDVDGVDIILTETRNEPSWRPHIAVSSPAQINDYLHAVEALTMNYKDVFESDQ